MSPRPRRNRKDSGSLPAVYIHPVTGKNLKPPSEAFECKRFVRYLESRPGILFTHVANESASMRQLRVNRSLGTRRGFPDYIIILPNFKMCVIEMKRRRGPGSNPMLSADQKKWLQALAGVNIPSFVCYGVDQAIAVIEQLYPSEQVTTTKASEQARQIRRPPIPAFPRVVNVSRPEPPELSDESDQEDVPI